jgi:protein translocase SecG subunit
VGIAMLPLADAVTTSYWLSGTLTLVLFLASLFLILLVLIQRGKGGGLTGALGGTGGSSAFGSKAGDTFTRVTIYTALVWILLIMVLIKSTQPIEPLSENAAVRPAPPAPVEGEQ